MSRAFLSLFLLIVTPAACAAGSIDELTVVTLPAPPFERPAEKAAGKHALEIVSSRPNQVTDEDAWFARHGLELPRFELDNLPSGIPGAYKGQSLLQAIHGSDHLLLLYGRDADARTLIAVDKKSGKPVYGYDFVNYLSPPGVEGDEFTVQGLTWATERDGVLYVSNGHRTYAKSSKGLNAYLTAVDLKTDKILWRSRPLVANTRNFEIVGDVIATGYGFTAEPDFLYLIDRKTGAVAAEHKVKSGPEYVIAKDGQLFVRCYDTDYVVRIK